MDTTALVEQQKLTFLTAADIKAQVQLIQEVMEAVMQDGHHYGTIPGTPKPTLLKPGAEKLGLTFRLRPEIEILPQSILTETLRTYRIKCRLVHIHSGESWGEGVGSCSSWEKKYAKQLAQDAEKSVDDLDNTILKMAAKRAHVAAILSATAASDIFTQDMEDEPPKAEESQGLRFYFGDHKGKEPKDLTTEQLCTEQARYQQLADDPTNKYQSANRKMLDVIKGVLAQRHPIHEIPMVKGDVQLFEWALNQLKGLKPNQKAVAIGVMNSHKDHPKLSLDQRTALIDYFNERFGNKDPKDSLME